MSAPPLNDPCGYLLVHFVEDSSEHKEKIYLSLSIGDDPLRWRRLNGGQAVLESTVGTTGVRDPHLVRRHDGAGFHLLATDLRVWADGPEIDWQRLSRHGSRDLVVWDSPDLLTWSEPRYVTVAPPTAGMAWAPRGPLRRRERGLPRLLVLEALRARRSTPRERLLQPHPGEPDTRLRHVLAGRGLPRRGTGGHRHDRLRRGRPARG
ncbi:hypothetical protein [Salana multivorans]